LSAVAFGTAVGFQDRLRSVSTPTVVVEELPHAANDVEPWEVRSELALVCPDVRERALELLPEREPDAFLARLPRAPASANLPTALCGYIFWRLVETACCALVAVGAVVALALLADAVR
jgi:hypothetical protein